MQVTKNLEIAVCCAKHESVWAGIGAGVDSFYEYLLKAYIMFGNSKYLFMFEEAYAAVNKYLKIGDEWYVEGDMRTGQHSHLQFNSLQAFWPGLQVAPLVLKMIRSSNYFYALSHGCHLVARC